MTARLDVVGLGENSVDTVYRVHGDLGPAVKLRISDPRVSPGGQVATTLCTCARLGLRCDYVGAFGGDEHAAAIRAALEAAGVATDAALTRDVPNRAALILLDDRTGERAVLWQRDPALTLTPDELPVDRIRAARLLHVDNVDEETAIQAARLARAAGLQVTTDIDVVTDRTIGLVRAATVPVLAEHAPAALTGEADPERALRRLRRECEGMLCVTLGERGAMLLAGDTLHHAPGFTVAAVDTTGAGDVFRGALIYALLRGDRPDAMLRFANAAAAISCTREGAIGGVPSLEEVQAFLTP